MIKDILEKSVVITNRLYFSVIDKLIGLVRKNHNAILRRTICQALEKLGNNEQRIAFDIAPQNALDVPFLQGLNQTEPFAIVLQGPICETDDMTYKTIEFYREMYPQAGIILSTWEGENEDICTAVEKQNAVVICNQKPTTAGIRNVNYQLTNSLSGVEKAEELGYHYVVKTRTDQRICRPYAFDFMQNLLRLFPITESCNQKERIISLSMYAGSMFSPYYVSDFLYYGNVYDVKNLLSAPLDTRQPFLMGEGFSRKENAESMFPPEIYIMKHYFRDVIGYPCSDTVKEYWDIIRKHLICLDSKIIGLMWNKYNSKYEVNRIWGDYFENDDDDELMATLNFTFTNWMNLYCGTMQYKSEYERYANASLNLGIGQK